MSIITKKYPTTGLSNLVSKYILLKVNKRQINLLLVEVTVVKSLSM